jgi:tetratricopeptide (TPR) repeat protein
MTTALVAALMLLAASRGQMEYDRANELFRSGRYEEAGQALSRALAADPDLVPALTLRGKLAMGFNRFDEAREAFTRAASLQPNSAYTQFLLGFFHYVDNDFRQAIGPLQRALKLDPTNARATFYLALTYEGLAESDSAIEYFERTLKLEAAKPSAETFTAYGRLLFTLGRYPESWQRIARALELDPKSRDAHYERGRLLFEEGKFAEAAAEGEQALAVSGPGTLDRQIHFLLARAYKKTGDKANAAKHLAAFRASPVTLRR